MTEKRGEFRKVAVPLPGSPVTDDMQPALDSAGRPVDEVYRGRCPSLCAGSPWASSRTRETTGASRVCAVCPRSWAPRDQTRSSRGGPGPGHLPLEISIRIDSPSRATLPLDINEPSC